jgi:single-stranded DNA-binding protein
MFETLVIGNVGSVKFFNAGKMPILNINIAASRRIGEREFTDWVSAKVWGERAEKLKEHIAKGMKLLVRGRCEAKAYKRDDDTLAGELILHVDTLEFLSPKQKTEEAGGESPELAEAGNEPQPTASEAEHSRRRKS